ncbi:hypothetical protein QBC45DRAFT_417414, partial [Copromyces sp. CBS 386.78]
MVMMVMVVLLMMLMMVMRYWGPRRGRVSVVTLVVLCWERLSVITVVTLVLPVVV